MRNLLKVCLILCSMVCCCLCHTRLSGNLKEVYSWMQIGYDFDGVSYTSDTDSKYDPDRVHFDQELNASERFFIQYNNVPVGFDVYENRVFVTVPRRRHGIPSTLNYVDLLESQCPLSPLLKPYPDGNVTELVSVYRPRVDGCGRLWAVDTGLLEVPGERRQIQKPAIVVFDLKTNEQILRYELKDSDLINERTSGGLTSITVDVSPSCCDDAYAYINDLATEGIIVFSMRERDSWRLQHSSFKHDESALNFTVAGQVINWKDGVFSIALSEPDEEGRRLAYYHALASFQEFAVDTEVLKKKGEIEGNTTLLGSRGPLGQSGSHSYHNATRVMFFANVAQDAILCWNVDKELNAENVAIVVQDNNRLSYISDLKIIDDDVWVLVNQMPTFVYSRLSPYESNFYIHRGAIENLIRGTVCDTAKLNDDYDLHFYRLGIYLDRLE